MGALHPQASMPSLNSCLGSNPQGPKYSQTNPLIATRPTSPSRKGRKLIPPCTSGRGPDRSGTPRNSAASSRAGPAPLAKLIAALSQLFRAADVDFLRAKDSSHWMHYSRRNPALTVNCQIPSSPLANRLSMLPAMASMRHRTSSRVMFQAGTTSIVREPSLPTPGAFSWVPGPRRFPAKLQGKAPKKP